MMYCAINDAFNNLPSSHKKNNNGPDAFDNYNDININNNKPNIDNDYPAFFTAQGDYSAQFFGTTINQLKDNNILTDSDSFTIIDSDYSSESLFDHKLSLANNRLPPEPTILKKLDKNSKSKKIKHEYYVDKMVKCLLEDQESVASSNSNNYVYQHVKSCKICKGQVNKKMKDHFLPELQVIQVNTVKNENFGSMLGYDLKEILIIILAGIILIFILDLLVKIGKRMK